MTLRSALAELRSARLIVARQGSGHVVTAYQEVAGPALLPELVRLLEPEKQVELCADMLLIRRHVAAAALDRLRQLDGFDTAGIEAAVERFAELAASDGATDRELALADVEVVGAVLEATRSVAFRLVVNPLGQALEALPALRAALYSEPELSAEVHQQLLRWLARPTRAGMDRLIETLAARDDKTIDALRETLP